MREAPAGPRLLSSVTGLLAVASLIAGGFVVVSTLLFICEDHFVGPVRDFWYIVPLLERFDRGGAWIGSLPLSMRSICSKR